MEKELGLYHQLKDCKTMKEIADCIPNLLYDQLTLIVLIYWCLVPVLAMAYSYITRVDADLLIYLSVLGSGMIGIYLTILRAIKLNIIQQLKNWTYVMKHLPQLSLFLMLIWSLFAAFHARDKYASFIGDSYSHEGFLTYISYAGFYGSTLFISCKSQWKKFLNIFCYFGTLLSILTILQYYGLTIRAFSGYMKLAATFHNTNHFGYYLTLSIMCVASLFLVSETMKQKILYLIQFIMMLSALIFNNTFGSYLAILGGSILIIIIFSVCTKQLKIVFFIPFIMTIIISFILNFTSGIINNNFQVLKEDTTEILKESEKSAQAGSGRWELWTNAIMFIKEEALLGYGQDNLSYNYAQVGIDMLKPHNEYLQHAVTLGIPAFLLYLISLGSLYVKAFINRKKLDSFVIISFCVISGYLISAFFGNTKFYVTPYFMVFLALATQVTLKE